MTTPTVRRLNKFIAWIELLAAILGFIVATLTTGAVLYIVFQVISYIWS